MPRLIKGKAVYDKPWYNSWRSMIGRCDNKNAWNYHYYGGRGISVCKEWHDPFVFGDWAIANGYEKGLTLDRIDSNGNYEPSNCRWATRKEQARNRRSCVHVEHNGEMHNLSEWAEICEIPYGVLRNRWWKGDRPPKLFRPLDKTHGNTWTTGDDGKRKWVNAI